MAVQLYGFQGDGSEYVHDERYEALAASAPSSPASARMAGRPLRSWAVWTAGFLSFPIAGLAGRAVAGRVDSPTAALVGGAVTGLVIGIGQSLAGHRRLDPRRWIPATTIGIGLGLPLGAALVGYGTSLPALAAMGAVTGLVLGIAQAFALPGRTRLREAWGVAMPALWALGWSRHHARRDQRRRTVHGLRRHGGSGRLGPVRIPAARAAARPYARRYIRPYAREGVPMNDSPNHVVFGAGAIGLATVEALRRRGESVRLVNRSGSAPVPEDVDVVGGDAKDPAFTTAVARGARVVYQILNPPYHQWVQQFPGLQAGVLAAAEATGARLVSMENVYMYGRPGGRPFTETSPNAATTRKGRLRGGMADHLLAAHRAGRVEVAIGRASDYFGPRGGGQTVLGDRVFRPALRGATAGVIGDPDQPHTYTYIPDIGEGLALLGEHPDAGGEIWHLPNDPRTHTTRQLVDMVYHLAGHSRTRLRSVPTLALRALGIFNPTVRELIEMRYEFEEPFIVDSGKITDRLGATATPLEEALEQTLADYRARAQNA
ncbi:NAD-dependent epimerase/dehydratase family protein [Streptomyces lunaelactis]|uniref:NAD-dependent epimerase/dehydratase family protein n=1 Tax=Streptomyces lunaelactis TaxID=1535768 RepID=UPI001585BD2B|nr:NAD-dependent epimerase/dehydratase family protein [Streptomyces lunaelactis]